MQEVNVRERVRGLEKLRRNFEWNFPIDCMHYGPEKRC